MLDRMGLKLNLEFNIHLIPDLTQPMKFNYSIHLKKSKFDDFVSHFF